MGLRHRFIIKPRRRAWLKQVLGVPLIGLLLPATVAIAQTANPAASSASSPVVLVLGDSMSAEYGLRRGTGWVALLAQQMKQAGRPELVVNASISGDTTSGGRARLPALLRQHRPRVLVIELGGNDALRGLPMDMTEQNLNAMVAMGQQAGARVLLVGMQVPPNYGKPYAQAFEAVFGKVAKATGAGLVPFLLAGVADGADSTALFQADRIHPNEQAQPQMMKNVWPTLLAVLKQK